VKLMVGRSLEEGVDRSAAEVGDVVLDVRGLGRDGEFSDIDLTLRAGEIVGLGGLIGAGRTEVAETIFGVRHADHGELRVNGEPLTRARPRRPGARASSTCPRTARAGLILEFEVTETVTLSAEHPVHAGGDQREP
jgi:ABC-type sugar transport system ATPase subunit